MDAAENNPPSYHLSRHYEVCKYYSLEEHTSALDVLLISTIIWNELTVQQQQWLQEAADESAQYEKKLWKEVCDFALQEVQKSGVKLYYPNKKPFVEKVKTIYETYWDQPEIYKLVQKIKTEY